MSTSMAELREIVAELSRSTKALRESTGELRESQAETARQIREMQERTDRQIAETSRELKKFVGQVGSEWGDLVEEMTKPSCLEQLQAAGIEVTQAAGETLSRRPGYEQEWDVVLVNGDEVVAVEAKSRLRLRDLDRLEERLKKFKGAFPQYKDHTVYGAVAAIKFDSGTARAAEKRGLFVFRPGGEIMKLVNGKGFRPKGY
jgi:hypothetical protein